MDDRIKMLLQLVQLSQVAGMGGNMPQPAEPPGNPKAQGHRGQGQQRHGAKGPASSAGQKNMLGKLPHQQSGYKPK